MYVCMDIVSTEDVYIYHACMKSMCNKNFGASRHACFRECVKELG
jgi:hypothetical protein